MDTTTFKPGNAAAAVENFADQAAARADNALQTTKRVTSSAIDSLQSGVDDLSKAAPRLLSRAAAQVEDLSLRGLERARETGDQVKVQVARARDNSVSYIRDEPVKSVLIAAAAGAAVAALVSWMARSRPAKA